jgi:hypothetical protein
VGLDQVEADAVRCDELANAAGHLVGLGAEQPDLRRGRRRCAIQPHPQPMPGHRRDRWIVGGVNRVQLKAERLLEERDVSREVGRGQGDFGRVHPGGRHGVSLARPSRRSSDMMRRFVSF